MHENMMIIEQFKKKRNLYNLFVKGYQFMILKFALKKKRFRKWKEGRKVTNRDRERERSREIERKTKKKSIFNIFYLLINY